MDLLPMTLSASYAAIFLPHFHLNLHDPTENDRCASFLQTAVAIGAIVRGNWHDSS